MKQLKVHDFHFTHPSFPGVRMRLYATAFTNVELTETQLNQLAGEMFDELSAIHREKAAQPKPLGEI
jgi:hypothetical protein